MYIYRTLFVREKKKTKFDFVIYDFYWISKIKVEVVFREI